MKKKAAAIGGAIIGGIVTLGSLVFLIFGGKNREVDEEENASENDNSEDADNSEDSDDNSEEE